LVSKALEEPKVHFTVLFIRPLFVRFRRDIIELNALGLAGRAGCFVAAALLRSVVKSEHTGSDCEHLVRCLFL
jgi:hypothetical protein